MNAVDTPLGHLNVVVSTHPGVTNAISLVAPPTARPLRTYTMDAVAARGISGTPLGLHGEGLYDAVYCLNAPRLEELRSHMVALAPGRSLDHDWESLRVGVLPRDADDVALTVAFYFTLVLSNDTPPTCGVESFGVGLHPWTCRGLTKRLAAAAKARGKRVVVGTQCPTVLDGLDLHDDAQRLYVVSRCDDGRDAVERVRVKPLQPDGERRLMLSELWVRGHLGGGWCPNY